MQATAGSLSEESFFFCWEVVHISGQLRSLGIGSDWPMIFWSGLTVCDANGDGSKVVRKPNHKAIWKVLPRYLEAICSKGITMLYIWKESTYQAATSIPRPSLPRYFDLHQSRWILTHPTYGHRSVAPDARPQGIDE